MIESAMNISASALAANRARMDIIAQNIANADTIRTDQAEPYRRRVVSLEASGNSLDFEDYLSGEGTRPGVRISAIGPDDSPFQTAYDPDHPFADENGYVTRSNVDTAREMLDLLSATRAYEANITAINAARSLLDKTLDIAK